MESIKRIKLPPLRRNYFDSGHFSLQPTKRSRIKNPQQPDSLPKARPRDLSVSPRYLNFHKNLINSSKVSLFPDLSQLSPIYRTPIHLVKLHDFELEQWRGKN